MNSVLIIDDDKELCALMKKCVEQENLSAVVAHGGLEGLRLLEKNKDTCSLIILDVMMPDMNGFQVLQKIREKNNVPVFVGFAVGDVAVGGLQFHQPVDDLRLISCGLIQCNGLRSKQFCNTHSGSPSIYQIILSSFSISAFVASPTLNAVALPQAVPRRSA